MIKNEKIEVLEEDETGNGSHLMGNISITYNELVELFNEPHETYSDKTDVEWNIKFDGTPFYIYNYKDGMVYNVLSGIPNECLCDWHIGGDCKSIAIELKEYLLENKPEGEDFPAITPEITNSIIERVKELDYTQVIQLNNFLYEIGV